MLLLSLGVAGRHLVDGGQPWSIGLAGLAAWKTLGQSFRHEPTLR